MSGPYGGARLDLELRRGARFYQELAYTDNLGAAPDLTGYTARLDIRARADVAPASAGTPILQLRTSPGAGQGTITIASSTTTVTLPDGSTASARVITLEASQSVTSSIAPGDGVYDLELVTAGGEVEVLVSGNVSILGEVTR